MTRVKGIVILLILCVATMFSCTNNISHIEESSKAEETGYPKGQVQIECIYYNGMLWSYDVYSSDLQSLKELPIDVTFIGQTLINDPWEIPSENFYTSHIKTGRNVYITLLGDALYIENQEEHRYYRYIP
ncbi:MAG: hypothetical protein J6L96_08165 [Clostridia bacterium]|nr:hypothetical protein [Clostridia bacterium]